MGLRVKENIRTNGLGMGETSMVSAKVPLSSMVIASAITAAAAGIASIGVEVFKHKFLRDEEDEMVNLPGLLEGFEIRGTVDAAKDLIDGLQKDVERAELAKEAREEAENEEDDEKQAKTRTNKRNTAKKTIAEKDAA